MVPPAPTASIKRRQQQQQQQQRQQPPRKPSSSSSNSSNTSSSWKPTGLYERSKKQQQDRERKLDEFRKEVMKDCTFTPEVGTKPSKKSNSGRTTTTKSASSGESVYSRLYRGRGGSPSSTRSSWSTPMKAPLQAQPHGGDQHHGTEESASRTTTTRTAVSRRIEGIYQEGVARVRAKPANDDHEKEIRNRNREAKELDECTFWPETHWGKMMANKQQSAPASKRSTKLIMQPSPRRPPVQGIQRQSRPTTEAPVDIPDVTEPPLPKEPTTKAPVGISDEGEPPLPKEIIVTSMDPSHGDLRLHPWDSPQRQQNKHHVARQQPVSPLREVSLGSLQHLVESISPRKDEKVLKENEGKREVRHKKRSSRREKKKAAEHTDYGSI